MDCDYCNYRKSAGESLQKLAKEEKAKNISKKGTLFN
jgi:2-iminoacetate synthase ThiH